MSFSFSVIWTYLKKFIKYWGFRYRRLKKSPYLEDHHKLQRYIWCLTNQETDFSKYIFLDETTVRLWDVPLYHWRQRSRYPNSIPSTDKFRRKLNVWAGISFQGSTPFAVIISFNIRFNLITLKNNILGFWKQYECRVI